MAGLSRVLGVLGMLGLLLAPAGCAARSRSQQPAAQAPVAAAPCARFNCAPGDTEPLTAGYAARLWSSPPPAAGDRSVPVVELLYRGTHQAWWSGRFGTGWSAQLSCLGRVCMVSSSLGAHGGAVETLLLVDGALSTPAGGSVEFDSGTPVVKDLGSDGGLDVLGTENDYKPNFAQGHNYWATYRLAGGRLVRTGCLPLAGHPQAPSALLTGPCPVVPGD